MSRKRPSPAPEEAWLFDLPLDPQPAEETPPEPEPAEAAGAEPPPDEEEEAAAGEPLDLFGDPPARPADAAASGEEAWPPYDPDEDRAPHEPQDDAAVFGMTLGPAPRLGQRLQAGLVDLAAMILVLGAVLAATAFMGIDLPRAFGPSLALFLAVFSFLYFTLPLAFWGRTPGMAIAGLVARNDDDQPLTFGQTFLRWLGAVTTVLCAGLPLLLALTGASLSDRISGSSTFLRAR